VKLGLLGFLHQVGLKEGQISLTEGKKLLYKGNNSNSLIKFDMQLMGPEKVWNSRKKRKGLAKEKDVSIKHKKSKFSLSLTCEAARLLEGRNCSIEAGPKFCVVGGRNL